jgi:hypothetical protein
MEPRTRSNTRPNDGKDYPVTGNANADMISLKRVNDRTVEATLKKGGKVTTSARRVASPTENAHDYHYGNQRGRPEGS